MATSTDLAQFDRRMRVIASTVTVNTAKGVRAAALAADQAVVFATPVDTGRARANWNVSIGNPRLEHDFEKKDYNSSLAQGASIIGTWTVGGGPIFISNNLPYIVPLEHGHSAQAPNGMTKFAMQAARAQLRTHRLLGRVSKG